MCDLLPGWYFPISSVSNPLLCSDFLLNVSHRVSRIWVESVRVEWHETWILKSGYTHGKVKAQVRRRDWGRGCACICEPTRMHIYYMVVGIHICILKNSFSVFLAPADIHNRLFMHRKAQLNSIFSNSHYSDLHPLSIPLTLCRYISGFLLLCCQSFRRGSPLRLRYWSLTSTKAGTVCQPEAPCRPTAPEVRNKENITVCAALKKTSRSTKQARRPTESSKDISEMWRSGRQTDFLAHLSGCSCWLNPPPLNRNCLIFD